MYKIVIQTKDKPIQTKSPILNTINLRQQNLNNDSPLILDSPASTVGTKSSKKQQDTQAHTYNSQALSGQLHLLRNLTKNINQQLVSKLKSCAVLVLNSYNNKMCNKKIENFIQDRHMEIQNVLKISNQVIVEKDVSLGMEFFVIIVFKSIVIAEQFYNFVISDDHLNSKQKSMQFSKQMKQQQQITQTNTNNNRINHNFICLYIRNITIIETDNYGIDSQNWQKLLVDEQDKSIWAQIPHCYKCLQILQQSITGLNLALQYKSQQTSPKSLLSSIHQTPVCKVCWTRSHEKTQCHKCQQIQDNWICLICGTVGCGRYKNADAYKHYTNSKHILSLDLQTDRIWNYKFDCFSHRVVGREGIMVMEERSEGQQRGINRNMLGYGDDQELQVQFWKYCNVVSEQLDRQRNFYTKIKQQEIERYSAQQRMLQIKIKQLLSIREQKKQNLKKKVKKNKKLSKKCSQLEQQYKQEIYTNKNLQEYVGSKTQNQKQEGKQKQEIKQQQDKQIKQKQKSTIVDSQAIRKKKQKLQELQKQIEAILSSLSLP